MEKFLSKKAWNFLALALALLMLMGSTLGVVNAKAADKDDSEESIEVERVSGEDRYETSVAISKKAYPEGAKSLVVASGEDFADALLAANLADSLDGPVLLVRKDTIPSDVREEVQRLRPENIHIVGGVNSISEEVEKELGLLSNVERHSGRDRYQTSVAVGNYMSEKSSLKGIAYSNGYKFSDVLSGTALLAKLRSKGENFAIILTDGKSIPEGSPDVGRKIVFGGKASVDIQELANANTYAGKDRYETARDIALAFDSFDQAILASGETYPDALSAISLASKYKAPILLTRSSKADKELLEIISNKVKNITIVGGSSTISDNVLKEISEFKPVDKPDNKTEDSKKKEDKGLQSDTKEDKTDNKKDNKIEDKKEPPKVDEEDKKEPPKVNEEDEKDKKEPPKVDEKDREDKKEPPKVDEEDKKEPPKVDEEDKEDKKEPPKVDEEDKEDKKEVEYTESGEKIYKVFAYTIVYDFRKDAWFDEELIVGPVKLTEKETFSEISSQLEEGARDVKVDYWYILGDGEHYNLRQLGRLSPSDNILKRGTEDEIVIRGVRSPEPKKKEEPKIEAPKPDFTGIDYTPGTASIVVRGYDVSGKRIDENNPFVNLGLTYKDPETGDLVKYIEHFNKIKGIDVEKHKDFQFRIEHVDFDGEGSNMQRLSHNGKWLNFEKDTSDFWTNQTTFITIELTEGPHVIEVDYRPLELVGKETEPEDNNKPIVDSTDPKEPVEPAEPVEPTPGDGNKEKDTKTKLSSNHPHIEFHNADEFVKGETKVLEGRFKTEDYYGISTKLAGYTFTGDVGNSGEEFTIDFTKDNTNPFSPQSVNIDPTRYGDIRFIITDYDIEEEVIIRIKDNDLVFVLESGDSGEQKNPEKEDNKDPEDNKDSEENKPIIEAKSYDLYIYTCTYDKDSGEWGNYSPVPSPIAIKEGESFEKVKSEIVSVIGGTKVDFYNIAGKNLSESDFYQLVVSDDLRYVFNGQTSEKDIVAYATRYLDGEEDPAENNNSSSEGEARLKDLKTLVAKAEKHLAEMRIKEEGLSEFKTSLAYAKKLVNSSNPSKEDIQKRYANLNVALEKHTKEDFNGKAYVIVKGYNKDGKLIEGSDYNSDLGFRYKKDGFVTGFVQHGNKIDDIDLKTMGELEFKVETPNGGLKKIRHNGKEVAFENPWGYETDYMTIQLAEGPNIIEIDYRENMEEKEEDKLNLGSYKLIDKNEQEKALSEFLDSNKPSLLVFGNANCSSCVKLMKDMGAYIDKENGLDFNYLEIITPVNKANIQSTIDETLDMADEEGINSLEDYLAFEGVDSIFKEVLGLKTTPSAVFLDKENNLIEKLANPSMDELRPMINSILDQGSSQEGQEPKEGEKTVSIVGGAASKKHAKPGDTISIEASQLEDFLTWELVSGNVEIAEPNNANTSFTMGQEDVAIAAKYKKPESARLSFAQRDANGQFAHLSGGEKDLIRSQYGMSLKDVKLTNMEGETMTLGDFVDGQRPVVFIETATYCGGCTNKWKDMESYIDDFKDVNMVFYTQSVNAPSYRDILSYIQENELENLTPYFVHAAGVNPIAARSVPHTTILDKECNVTNLPDNFGTGRNSGYNASLRLLSELIADSISVK